MPQMPGGWRPSLPDAIGTTFRAVVCVGGLVFTAYVVSFAVDAHRPMAMLVWFGGAVIGHDLVLFPLYAAADRAAVFALRRPGIARRVPVSPLNYLRWPTLAALLLFCVYFPGIVAQAPQTYAAATGQTQEPFLGRYLVTVAVLYAVSAIAYGARVFRAPSGSTARRLDASPPIARERSHGRGAGPGC